jgi:Ni/Fe-hydrogenase subunit HybB-like protein
VTRLTYRQIDDDVLGALAPPRRRYFAAMIFLMICVGWACSCWVYQVHTGMGVAGINHPVGWGVYIANFVFWVGIAHSGTLISAILHLVRSKWRNAVSRSAEAMTVFAIMTAGLFPLIHLGRLWVFYFIIPYPSQRQLWPNFTSPLVWDVCAITTYLIVSVIFFYVGLIPDLAGARDRCASALGPGHPRTRLYRRLCLGWHGAASQWRHYDRGYLFFAALATPLVVSVHSVVSWDFAMGILPGWHTTIFAPYFVAGAIHSGLAMVLTLLIPMRRLLKLERIITPWHLESVAKTMIVTTLIIGYAYVIEPFIAWYSGDRFEWQFAQWRATGWMAWMYWALVPLNVLFPLLFVFPKVRRRIWLLLAIAIGVNVGMWLERVLIVVGSTSHDFMPHNWGQYWPTWVEWSITGGALTFFLFWFLGYSKLLPTVPVSELKELQTEGGEAADELVLPGEPAGQVARSSCGVVGVFAGMDELLAAHGRMGRTPFKRMELFSPVKIADSQLAPRRPGGLVRYWALGGALLGLTGGFALAIGSALVNGLIVGGKPVVAIVPFCIVGFEGTILLGAIGNLIGLIVHARLGRKPLPAAYDGRFSQDKFGLFVACGREQVSEVRALMGPLNCEELRVVGGE